MEVTYLAVSIVTMVFSTLSFIISIACYIQWKASSLSKYEFVQVPQDQLFESDVNKINKELEDDELDDEIDKTFEPDKQFNEVIL